MPLSANAAPISQATGAAAPAPEPRMPELDSLRGLAAFTVVLHHFALMWPDWTDTIDGPLVHHAKLGLLYPLYAGQEAVILFFVLSGLVLALPYLRRRGQPYPIFLGRRVLRIYGPYLAALALSVGGAAVWHGAFAHGGWPADFWSQPVSLPLVLQHVAFLGVYDWRQFDFVVWSLIYEMRISILFPLLVWAVLKLRMAGAILLALAGSALALLAGLRQPAHNLAMTLHYVAFFILGILLAQSLPAIAAWYRGLSKPLRAVLFLAAFFAYSLPTRIARHSGALTMQVAGDWGVALGAVGLIVLSLHSAPVRRLLNMGPARFLGRISFSLYLLHAPILLAIAAVCSSRLSAWQQFPLYMVASLGLATTFCLAVEEPFMRLGRRLR